MEKNRRHTVEDGTCESTTGDGEEVPVAELADTNCNWSVKRCIEAAEIGEPWG